ncbi:MAG: tRNA (N6-isopentenyl adenosine(37)-C2)-methylthiotransferase MiaB [Dehalococcoidia bacterium]|nr:tRNA (N6-isopentenyl adenosine(37)-C2)-methylthiotransferase MiaB [Dehalococcoidia bacterium]
MKAYIWTIGCQMNRAESIALGADLQSLGFEPVRNAREADIVVLNTCVVRQSAEDKVRGMLGFVSGIKSARPHMHIAVTGCFVEEDVKELNRLFPFVDHFFGPGRLQDFHGWLCNRILKRDTDIVRIEIQQISPVSAYLPIIQGCNNFCSYCIVPYRRGRERSRPAQEILAEAEELVKRGAREIVLLGQNVNTYGHDLSPASDLSRLLYMLSDLNGLHRIRFLTNHPKDMSESLIQAIKGLPKVCRHVCLPLQAGDDEVLKKMNRGYTRDDYFALLARVRQSVQYMAISTDLIVGFPGETEQQFNNSYAAIKSLRFDTVHVAAYSSRPGTAACAKYLDDVPQQIKLDRLHAIEELQSGIQSEINGALVGTTAEILVEGTKAGKWYGRTGSDRLVFFKDERDLKGQLVEVEIQTASPWALQGVATPVRSL